MQTTLSLIRILVPRLLFCLGVITVSLASFAVCQQAQAVSPAPDGGYAGDNTAEGQNALFSLTTGRYNAAVGWVSLYNLASGNFNTGIGAGALFNNTADGNTATGAAALLSNTTGTENTANGTFALLQNADGTSNTAVGFGALEINNGAAPYASANTAIGAGALSNNIDGFANDAVGRGALASNTAGSANQAIGVGALFHNDYGRQNVAIGDSSMANNVSGFYNTVIGDRAGPFIVAGNGNVYLGSSVGGGADESNTIRLGIPDGSSASTACYIGGIYGQTFGPADMTVRIGSNGRLGTMVSSRRFKQDIKPMDKASEAVLALKPMTFHYKSDTTNALRFGLVAEDVAEVSRQLVILDKEGKPLSVRYEDVNAMLLNEFLKEYRRVAEQETTIAQLKKEIGAIVAHSKEQDSQIQRVRDQVQINRPDTRVTADNP